MAEARTKSKILKIVLAVWVAVLLAATALLYRQWQKETAEIDANEKLKADMAERIEWYQKSIAECSGEIDKERALIQDCESQLSAADKSAGELGDSLNESQAKIAELNEKLKKIQARLAAPPPPAPSPPPAENFEDELDELKSRRELLQEKLSEANERFRQCRMEHEKVCCSFDCVVKYTVKFTVKWDADKYGETPGVSKRPLIRNDFSHGAYIFMSWDDHYQIANVHWQCPKHKHIWTHKVDIQEFSQARTAAARAMDNSRNLVNDCKKDINQNAQDIETMTRRMRLAENTRPVPAAKPQNTAAITAHKRLSERLAALKLNSESIKAQLAETEQKRIKLNDRLRRASENCDNAIRRREEQMTEVSGMENDYTVGCQRHFWLHDLVK